MENKKEAPTDERRKMQRQAYEAIKIMPNDKLKENVVKLQRDANIK